MLAIRCAAGRRALLVALVLSVPSSGAQGQTTTFTYQGQLSNGGVVATGSYDLRFALFDAAAGGAQIGSPQTVSAVSVSNGLFTVQLDFGVNAFPGANRFLEVSVKPAGSGTFTTLAPRQQISSSPYSLRTLSAATADALSSACVGCVQSAQINSVAGSKISGAIPAASVPTGSGNYIQNGTAQQANANFNIAGNGVVGGNLTVAGTLNANVSGNFIQNRTTPQADSNFNVSGNGTVGGTLSASKVEILAQDGLRISGYQPFLTLSDLNDNGKRGLVSSGYGDLGFYTESAIGTVPTVLIKNVSGNVGIGASVPNHKLTVSGGPLWTSYSWTGSVALDNAAAIAWQHNTSNQSFGIGQTNGGLYFFRTNSAPGTTGSVAAYDFSISDSGTVSAAGDAVQARDKGGWVKAMALVDSTATILRCYNSSLTGSAASSPPCGLSASRTQEGVYDVTAGFTVGDRFISVTTFNTTGGTFKLSEVTRVQGSLVTVYTKTDGGEFADSSFFIFVF